MSVISSRFRRIGSLVTVRLGICPEVKEPIPESAISWFQCLVIHSKLWPSAASELTV